MMHKNKEEIIRAAKWWRSLSINQQNEYAKKHLPYLTAVDVCKYYWLPVSIWVPEGRPEPEINTHTIGLEPVKGI